MRHGVEPPGAWERSAFRNLADLAPISGNRRFRPLALILLIHRPEQATLALNCARPVLRPIGKLMAADADGYA